MKYTIVFIVSLLLFIPGMYWAVFTPSQSAHEGVKQDTTPLNIDIYADGLDFPWAIEFLPSGSILVTERSGQIKMVDNNGKVSAPIANVPAVFFEGQGGLLDITISPDFSQDHMVYFSYAEHGENGKAGTAVARARLVDSALEDLEVIFRQQPKTAGKNHFGSRLAFDHSGHLFIGLGERFDYSEQAQALDNHLGKVVRIKPDGSIPDDNPFINTQGALPEIWSYGHRNIQGMAVHPESGHIWIHEHGPRGGDEINIPRAGKNYGWPEASYGSHYSMLPIEDEHSKQGFVEPIYYWTPSIAPSGMWFYTGDLFKQWQNNLLVGALAGQHLARLSTNGKEIDTETRLLTDLELRIRDVTQGPDGAIYVISDSDTGKILRLTPNE